MQEDFSSKTKKDAPQPNATTDSYFFNDLDKIAEAEAGAPPPVEVMDSKPAPTLPTNDAMAIQETQAAPAKDEDLSKAKAKTEARKQAEPAAKPGAPAPRKITGRATDENGEPLVGVSILASGKGIGTVTDLDGTYALGVPTGTESLIFTYTSYTPMQITLGKNDRLDVKLTEGDAMLSEVEVTAYDQTGGESAPIESPRPVGGFRKFKTYVSKNMRHPEADGQPRPRQIVKVRFTIQAVGTLSNFTAKGEAPQAYKDEAVRLLREGPRWSGTPITMASYRFVFE